MTAAERLARALNDEIDGRLAPWFGYEPAREPTGTWDDIPEENQRLMIEVCEDLIRKVFGEGNVVVPIETLMGVVDPDPCRLDHHGYCQSHGWLDEGDCPNAKLQALLADAAKAGERPAP